MNRLDSLHQIVPEVLSDRRDQSFQKLSLPPGFRELVRCNEIKRKAGRTLKVLEGKQKVESIKHCP